jgi:hypothetical protein
LLEAKGAPISPIDAVEGWDARQGQTPDNPVGLKPVLAQGEGWLVLASDVAELQAALRAKADNTDVRASAGFKKLADGMPTAYNGMGYMSLRLGAEIGKLAEQAAMRAQQGPGMGMVPMAWAQMLGVPTAGPGRLGIRLNLPDGIQGIIQGDVAADQLVQAGMIMPAGILVAVAVPGFIKARATSQVRACQENLQKLDGAKEQWALDNRKNTGDTPTSDDLFGVDKYIRREPICPAGGTYTLNPIGTDPTCTLAPQGHDLP